MLYKGGGSMRINRIAFVTALVKQDLKMVDLEKITGVSRCTLSAIKAGKSCSKETANKLIAVLGQEIVESEK